MTDSFDLDHVSGSLPAFLAGELARDEADRVIEHLAECAACRQEARAVELLRGPAGDPMTSSERLALEHRVMAGIAGDDPTPAPVRKRTPGRARLAQALGAAAVLATVGTFFYLGGMSGGDGQSDAGSGISGGDTVDEAGEPEMDREARRGDSGTDSLADAAGGSGGGAADAGKSAGAGVPASNVPGPRFSIAADPYTPADLERLGESGLDSVRFANYYSADDADGRFTLLEQLVRSADKTSGASVAAQVEECGTQVLDSKDPIIPTFGAIGRLRDQDVVVLGFAWTRRATGPLDRYMVWAWERGSCDTAVDFVDGRIEAAG